MGIDSSLYFCGLLRRAASGRSVAVEVVEADLREIPYRAEFDAVLNLHTVGAERSGRTMRYS